MLIGERSANSSPLAAKYSEGRSSLSREKSKIVTPKRQNNKGSKKRKKSKSPTTDDEMTYQQMIALRQFQTE